MSDRRPSYAGSYHSSSRLPPAEAAIQHPAAAHPPPASQLPPLPSEAYASSSYASTSTARYSQSTGRSPTSPEAQGELGRQRGESSPVSSRQRDSGWLNGGQDPSTRRQSSSTAPRRIVDGREETREERRVRKERERAARELQGESSTGKLGLINYRSTPTAPSSSSASVENDGGSPGRSPSRR